MSRESMAGLLLALAMLLPGAAAGAGEPGEAATSVPRLRQEANRAYAAGDHEAFRKAVSALHELRPNNGEYMYRLVLAHALLNDLTPAFNVMLMMQRQGLSYDFNQTPDSKNLRDAKLYGYLNDLMIKAGQPLGSAALVAELGGEAEWPQAIAWDPHREAFLVGTAAHGRVLALAADGSVSQLLSADRDNGLWGVFDLLVEPKRARLWVASAATPRFARFDPLEEGRSALFEFDLETLDLIRRYPVPVDGLPHRLRNLALAPNGDLFLADGTHPIVYVKRAGADRLQPFFASREMTGLRGIALSPDGRSLYLADRELGIARLELESARPAWLQKPDSLNLGGLTALEYWNGSLVIIQNGIRPQRIMRLQLNEEGTGVAEVAPIAVALEEFRSPNDGTVRGDELVFFANSHRRDGRDPVRVMRAPLEGVGNIMPPDMQRYLERRATPSAGSGDAASPRKTDRQRDG